jgi:hypothetical protein
MAAKLDVCRARMDKRARYRIKDGNREKQIHPFFSFQDKGDINWTSQQTWES